MSDAETKEEGAKSGPSWWDSYWGLGFLVAAIFAARAYILEPYKIPSGSMEPTLIGHEDYGDRIITNKLAYVEPKQIWIVLGAAVLFIAFGFIASRGWKSAKSIVFSAVLLIGVVGGTLFSWSRNAVASEPKRFEVVVFEYEKAWEDKNENSKTKINYIKRLCGLPGETIVISGGDLFKRDELATPVKDTIIRKWEEAPEVQEQFWYPVAKCWIKTTHHQMNAEDKANLAFPWEGAEAGKPGAKLGEQSLEVDGSAPVELTYKYPVTNLHIKQGRWLFKHVDCPAAHLPGEKDENGITWRNKDSAPSEFVHAYVDHPWEGVQCPQCKRVIFPLSLGTSGLQPWQPGSPIYNRDANSTDENVRKQNSLPPEVSRFFYGGDDIVGDLKIELELNVESGGKVELEAGSNIHSGLWSIGAAPAASTEQVHAVKASTPALTPGHHTLKLSYVDATVIAELDGAEIERQVLDLEPIWGKAAVMKSLARVKFDGVTGRVTRLDLFRDQYYLPMLKSSTPNERASKELKPDLRDGGTILHLRDGKYLMLGDNSPSSSDSRIWGPVPKQNIVGRASFIWWPMSRWKIITHGHGETSVTKK